MSRDTQKPAEELSEGDLDEASGGALRRGTNASTAFRLRKVPPTPPGVPIPLPNIPKSTKLKS